MKYYVEYTITLEVEAKDASEAWRKAEEELQGREIIDTCYVYIDGDLVS